MAPKKISKNMSSQFPDEHLCSCFLLAASFSTKNVWQWLMILLQWSVNSIWTIAPSAGPFCVSSMKSFRIRWSRISVFGSWKQAQLRLSGKDAMNQNIKKPETLMTIFIFLVHLSNQAFPVAVLYTLPQISSSLQEISSIAPVFSKADWSQGRLPG